MQAPPSQVSVPYIRASHLANHINKPVNIAGKVVSVNGPSIQLDAGDGSMVNTRRSADDVVPVQVGQLIMIRGIVQGDTSVVGIAGFPVTVLGEQFDLTVHNQSVDVMTQNQFSPLFVG